MHRDGPIDAELRFRSMNLLDEVDVGLRVARHSNFWPIHVLEVTNRSRHVAVDIGKFELSQHVLRHVVLIHQLQYQVANLDAMTLARPVFDALLLKLKCEKVKTNE